MVCLRSGEGAMRPHVSELVINWHITEACNYKCRYCYAKWDDAGRELLHDWTRVRNLLDELQAFFHPENDANPLSQHMMWSSIRLNLAGGEPLLYHDALLRALEYARSKGMGASIITNGSRLTSDLIDRLAPLVSIARTESGLGGSCQEHRYWPRRQPWLFAGRGLALRSAGARKYAEFGSTIEG